MKETLLAVVLVVFAGAFVLVFAMLAELGNRISTASRSASDALHPVAEVPLGSSAEAWPPELESFAQSRDGNCVILVLSTACGACVDVVEQMKGLMAQQPSAIEGIEACCVVVSSSELEIGAAFVADTGLTNVPIYVDVDGEWVSSNFNLRKSPVALRFIEWRCAAALGFNDLRAVLSELGRTTQGGEMPGGMHARSDLI